MSNILEKFSGLVRGENVSFKKGVSNSALIVTKLKHSNRHY